MNLTIRQLRAFLAVADLRNFTAASKYLCITQSAVSSLINEMEHQMEVSLFDRTSRSVKLSPDGEKFLPAAMRVVEEFQHAENIARDLKEDKKTLIRVAGAPLIACAFLPEIIHAFKQQNPNIQVQLIDKPMSQLQHSIMLGEADFGIGPERPLEPEIKKQPLFATEIAMFCHPNYPLHKNEVAWQDIQKKELIAVGNESIPMICATAGVHIEPKMMVEHMATAMSLAAQGEGVVIAGIFSRHYARRYQLATCALRPAVYRSMNLYYHAWRKQTLAMQRFNNYLIHYIKKQHESPAGLMLTGDKSAD
ncbi:LysR family transcriptional regulator [Escherichia fergusonii]|uniref:LysR family transcriptional regulator n=1 Tax=Escherichia fergusonii TaxID=564 RepID=UPI000F68F218|nr:LysR family transcriptional regulator [Escherichia fergusonii]QCZ30408.1 LysR family transcriptional regulator [Escherichia fergusonii]